jgi:hypothetical protein
LAAEGKPPGLAIFYSVSLFSLKNFSILSLSLIILSVIIVLLSVSFDVPPLFSVIADEADPYLSIISAILFGLS